jgi:hypothetical protein
MKNFLLIAALVTVTAALAIKPILKWMSAKAPAAQVLLIAAGDGDDDDDDDEDAWFV